MPFVPDPEPTAGGHFVPDADGYWSDVGHNAVNELKGMVPTQEGLLNTGKNLAALTSIPSGGLPSLDDLKQMPEALGQVGKTVKNVGESVYRTVTDPTEEFRQRPIGTALNVASVAAPVLDELRGPADTLSQYAGRFGENQMGKLHGTSQAQFRQLGRENFGDAMRSSYDMGDANLLQGPIGREQAIAERIHQLGSDLGDIRQDATASGSSMTPQEMSEAIRKELEPKFSPGGKYYDEAGAFNKGLSNIAAMPEGGISNFAARSHDLNDVAVGNKLFQPVNADTQIANSMSRLNDAQIAERVGPEMAEHYNQLKEEYGNAASLRPMELRAEGKEALGRGPDTAFGTVKDIAHSLVGGPKLGAQIGFGAESALKGFANNRFLPSSAGPAIADAGENYSSSHEPPINYGPEEILQKVASEPSLAKWIPIFQEAAQRGPQAVIANHFTLMQKDPEYNKLAIQRYAPPMR